MAQKLFNGLQNMCLCCISAMLGLYIFKTSGTFFFYKKLEKLTTESLPVMFKKVRDTGMLIHSSIQNILLTSLINLYHRFSFIHSAVDHTGTRLGIRLGCDTSRLKGTMRTHTHTHSYTQRHFSIASSPTCMCLGGGWNTREARKTHTNTSKIMRISTQTGTRDTGAVRLQSYRFQVQLETVLIIFLFECSVFGQV